MVTEGYRTRDAHLLEWFVKLLQGGRHVDVRSRPEPFPRQEFTTWFRHSRPLAGVQDNRRSVIAVPPLRDRQRWWVRSVRHYEFPRQSAALPAIAWNPLVAAKLLADDSIRPRLLTVDLLDDWTIHPAFGGIQSSVRPAYERIFGEADNVVANAEGTLDLARRFGRDDAILIPNGCDPERFSTTSIATGPLTVGYLGKIGSRLHFDLIAEVMSLCQDCDFVFAGPTMDRRARSFMRSLPSNAVHVGDVPYPRVPEFLQRLDIGWIPHRVGEGEVGGDAIKLYEYRACGLPVLSTPISGVAERGLRDVTIRDSARQHADWIHERASQSTFRIRRAEDIPAGLTWKSKAQVMLDLLDIHDYVGSSGDG
nr:glycosyltransferase [Nocardioides panaciterrulae]